MDKKAFHREVDGPSIDKLERLEGESTCPEGHVQTKNMKLERARRSGKVRRDCESKWGLNYSRLVLFSRLNDNF